MSPERVAFAAKDLKLRCAQLLRFAPALRVTSSFATAGCGYAVSRASGVADVATIIQPAPVLARIAAQTSTCPQKRVRPRPPYRPTSLPSCLLRSETEQ